MEHGIPVLIDDLGGGRIDALLYFYSTVVKRAYAERLTRPEAISRT